MKVICEKKDLCKYSFMCGGAKPHLKTNECGKCPIDSKCKCIPVEDIPKSST